MNKLVFYCFCVAIIGSVVAQNRIPPVPGFVQPGASWNLNDPSHPCNQPGANCNQNNQNNRFAEDSSYIDQYGNRERYTRVCDHRGCYERRLSSGSSSLKTSFLVLTFIAMLASIKNTMH